MEQPRREEDCYFDGLEYRVLHSLNPDDCDVLDDVFEASDETTEYYDRNDYQNHCTQSTYHSGLISLHGAPEMNSVQDVLHKTILVGDSGVGKTSILVQFNTGKFWPASYAATVGIGFTVMLLGDTAVGKTCLLVQFKDKTFLSGSFIPTVGIDFRNKVLTVDEVSVKLQIWDTAGQERFRSVTHAYYRDAHALLLLFDVTNRKSFDNTRAWLAEINEYAHRDVIILLLGNKCDCDERVVAKEDGERLAREYNVGYMETSAKTGANVEQAFIYVARALTEKRSRLSQDDEAFGVKEYVEPNQWAAKSSCARCNT